MTSEARYRQLFESVADAILVLGRDGVVDCNRRGLEMFRCTREEMIGRQPADFSPPTQPGGQASAEAARVRFEAALAGEPQAFAWVHRRFDGTLFHAESTLNCAAIGGEALGLCVVRDVTDRQALEEQLRQALKMDAIGQLAGGLAHDFNNALGVILGCAERCLLKASPGGGVAQDLNVIRDAARRSASLTRQLLAFARKQAVSPRVLDLGAVVADMATMLRRLIGEDVRLEIRSSSDLWPTRIDPSQVDQLLANLVLNARDALAGTIVVATRNAVVRADEEASRPGLAPGEYVLLSVSDDGCGMEPEVVAHVFEPFFTTKALGRGTGLGLATVYGIVQQSSGHVGCRSVPGRGATFEIHLPRAAGEPARRVPERVRETRGAGETLLVVEDDLQMLEVTADTLSDLGYEVLRAAHPAEALAIARAHAEEIRLVVTDVVMPEMNGRELVARLRLERPSLRCLYVSGYAADVIANGGVIEEGLHFLAKPFAGGELAARVREALDQPVGPQ